MIVTCTGVDATTPLTELQALARDFPFAEWAVLMRGGNLGRKAPRYPAADELRRIADHFQTHGIRAALHLCGRLVDDFIGSEGQGAWPAELYAVLPAFNRVQLNARLGTAHAALMPAVAARLRQASHRTSPARVIVQWNRHNPAFWAALGDPALVDGLVDASGGRGLLPERWPARAELPFAKVGYAGGLAAQTLAAQWPALRTAAGGLPDWIDAETALRDEGDRFCLKRCRAWLEVAARLGASP